MTFDYQAFTATVHTIRRDLDTVDQAVAWLYPTAYEQRTGGGNAGMGHTICRECGDSGLLANGQPCDECVVATIGDAGEIVVRRHHIAEQLDAMAKELDRAWDLTKGMSTRVARLANLIDKGASRLPGMDPISVDPREVAEQIERKNKRAAMTVVRPALPDELAPAPDIAKHAADLIKRHVETQERIEAHRAKMEAEGEKTGNRWRK